MLPVSIYSSGMVLHSLASAWERSSASDHLALVAIDGPRRDEVEAARERYALADASAPRHVLWTSVWDRRAEDLATRSRLVVFVPPIVVNGPVSPPTGPAVVLGAGDPPSRQSTCATTFVVPTSRLCSVASNEPSVLTALLSTAAWVAAASGWTIDECELTFGGPFCVSLSRINSPEHLDLTITTNAGTCAPVTHALAVSLRRLLAFGEEMILELIDASRSIASDRQQSIAREYVHIAAGLAVEHELAVTK